MIILDTNVLSEMMKLGPSPALEAWLSTQSREDLFTTTITLAEIFYGIELLPKGRRRDGLQRVAEAMFTEDFAGRVLTFDESPARFYATISATRRVRGRPISVQDAQIAVIAKGHDATLVTRDTDDFEGCGVRLINPWQT